MCVLPGRIALAQGGSLPPVTVEIAETEGSPQPGSSKTGSAAYEPWRVEMGVVWVPATDFSDSAGDVGWFDVPISISRDFMLTEMLTLTPFFSYTYSNYDFDDSQALVAGANSAWDDVHDIEIGALLAVAFSEEWAVLVGGSAGLAGEDDALGDGQYGTATLGVMWAPHDKLAFTGGLAFRFGLKETEVWPLIGVDWIIDEHMAIKTEGTGLRFGYQVMDDLNIGLFGGYESRVFRMDEGGPVPDGVAEVVYVPVGVDARYQISDNLAVTCKLGAGLDPYIEVEDDDDNRVGKEDLDTIFFLGVGLSATF